MFAKYFVFLPLAVVAGCVTTATGTPTPTQGFADGTKTVLTPGLTFTDTAKALFIDASDNITRADSQIVYRTTSDVNVIVATVNGQEIILTWNVLFNAFIGSNATYGVRVGIIGDSTSQQVSLVSYNVNNLADSNAQNAIYPTGLTTDPAAVAALSGTASYSGVAEIMVLQEDAFGGGVISFGDGTGTLDADFGTGTITGSLSLDDSGSNPAGFDISPTTITIAETTISGNGFTSTLSGTAADLAMSSIGSTSIEGTFFGVDASDVGASFSGSGIGSVGLAPAYFIGGFIGE